MYRNIQNLKAPTRDSSKAIPLLRDIPLVRGKSIHMATKLKPAKSNMIFVFKRKKRLFWVKKQNLKYEEHQKFVLISIQE